jgi:dCTP deaminase
MSKGSVKPPGIQNYAWFIKKEGLGTPISPLADGTFTLDAKSTYVFRLKERLNSSLADGHIYGQATAKSSVGRVDVLARLIADGMDSYEGFTPEGVERSGDLYLEVTPITLSVRVKPGISLSQLRFFHGRPQDAEIKAEELFKTVLQGGASLNGSLSVDLTNATIGGCQVAAFRASPSSSGVPVPLWEESSKPNPCHHWSFVQSNESKRLSIEPEKFYLLRSKEKLSLPEGIAVYCRASDETIGEMRIHYAGFAHPLFGRCRKDGGLGTPLIFEVRGHQVPVTLAHGEKMANLIFYRMSQDCTEEKQKDDSKKAYENQELELSKFFAPWPAKLTMTGDGAVEAA